MPPLPFLCLNTLSRSERMYDFISILDQNSIQYKLEVPGWINIECPICRHSGKRGFKGGLNVAGGYFHCWNCGGHKLEEVFAELLGVTIFEANKILHQYSDGMDIAFKLQKKKAVAKTISLPGGPLLLMHKKYLIKRRFDPDFLVNKYKIQGEGITGEWKFRIIIPIIYEGKIVAFQGRDITEIAPLRYKTLDVEKCIVDPKTILYNLDNCKTKTLCIVEGAFDVWRLGDGFACTLGTSMEIKQINVIERKGFEKVYFIFDPEKSAQERAIKQAKLLASHGIKVEVIDMEWEHDPGDLTEMEVKILRKELGL